MSADKESVAPLEGGELATNPAEALSGMVLEGGWRVGERIPRSRSATGGQFSCCYIVTSSNGQVAFLKALDFLRAMSSADLVREIKDLTSDYEFERSLLDNTRRMDRVVHSLAHGIAQVDATPLGRVPYLILEMGARDVRAQLALVDRHDTGWRLRTLHNVSTGLKQLHSKEIAHQDTKPSNVVVFDPRLSKLTDLGRACMKGHGARHDSYEIAGDPRYAPPELLYSHLDPDWSTRRLGTDFYHLGSLAVFLFSGAVLTPLIVSLLAEDHRPGRWGGSYRAVLPYVREAFQDSLAVFSESIPDQSLRGDLTAIVRELCEPDPDLRGDPISRGMRARPLTLVRYVTRFDLLAGKAEFAVRRSL